MTTKNLIGLFVVVNVLYFAAVAWLIYWGATSLYNFAIYQGWIRP